jgi:wyosine [tRNA(Phe)-imidazoG37] synthetase (radical SAM superfamily)
VKGFADTDEDFERFTWLIRAMEKSYIEVKAAKRIQERQTAPSKNQGR